MIEVKVKGDVMEDRVMIEFGKIFRFVISKFWIFVLVLFICVGGNVLLTKTTSNVDASYFATSKIMVTQKSREDLGEFMDNSARMQPVYDIKEILVSGVFAEEIVEHLDFDITVAELKDTIEVEQILPSRLLSIKVTRANAEEVVAILQAIEQYGIKYLEQIVEGVEIKNLESTDITAVQEERSTENGIKMGTITGVAGCVILACVLVLMYLMNGTIRYKEDVERQLGLPVIGEFKEVRKKG